METRIPLDVALFVAALVGGLIAYIWHDQARRIVDLEKHRDQCMFPDIRSDLSALKTDVQWIKQKLAHI